MVKIYLLLNLLLFYNQKKTTCISIVPISVQGTVIVSLHLQEEGLSFSRFCSIHQSGQPWQWMATDIGTVNGHALSVELKEQCRNETGLNTCEFVYGEKHSDFLCTISLQPIHHAINSMITDSG